MAGRRSVIMKANDIIDVYRSGCKKILRYFHRIKRDFNEDENHNFRVEIKKLRAFIRLVNLCNTENLNRIPRAIKKFYQTAGDIRNIEIHEQRIERLCEDLLIEKPQLYLQSLINEKEKKTKKLKRAGKDVSIKQFKKELINTAPAELADEIKIQFVQKSLSNLLQLLFVLYGNEEALHEIRKLLKDLMYNYEYLQPYVTSMMPAGLDDLNALEGITSLLGDFHDLYLGIYFLSPKYLNKLADKVEIDTCHQLKAYLELRKENIRHELINLLKPVKQELEMKSYSERQVPETRPTSKNMDESS
jgi:CHAD domain-containing protein